MVMVFGLVIPVSGMFTQFVKYDVKLSIDNQIDLDSGQATSRRDRDSRHAQARPPPDASVAAEPMELGEGARLRPLWRAAGGGSVDGGR
jgi:hypothetical protein